MGVDPWAFLDLGAAARVNPGCMLVILTAKSKVLQIILKLIFCFSKDKVFSPNRDGLSFYWLASQLFTLMKKRGKIQNTKF